MDEQTGACGPWAKHAHVAAIKPFIFDMTCWSLVAPGDVPLQARQRDAVLLYSTLAIHMSLSSAYQLLIRARDLISWRSRSVLLCCTRRDMCRGKAKGRTASYMI